MRLRRDRFGELIRRQLDLFVEDEVELLREAEEAERAYDNAEREVAEDAYGDYQLVLEAIADALADLRDTAVAVQRCRRLLDLDADPLAIDEVLSADPLLAPLVASAPGLRLPSQVDGFEVAVRAIVGQQVSVAGARTLLGRFAETYGTPVTFDLGMYGWTPTLELTVHVRAVPAPGWLRVVHSTRNVAGGLLEEDAEVWDSADRLVAQSRQLARVPR